MSIKSKAKFLLGYLLYAFYIILNVVFYKKKKRIIFISFPDASDNSWYLYKYALANLEGYEFIWLVSDNSDLVRNKIFGCEVSNNENKVVVIKRWSLKGLLYFINSRFVFHTHGTYFFIRKAFNAPTIVNLWHGMPIKAIGFLDGKNKSDVCYSDYTIATSDAYREIMSEAFDIPIENVLVTGLPRNDVLHSGVPNNIRQNILSSLSIKISQDVLVWLPTYRTSVFGEIRKDALNFSFLDDLDDNFLECLNSLCCENNISIVIKLHPMDSIPLDLKAFHFSNIYFYDSRSWQNLNIDLYDLLSFSRGVISDFSSVMIDCLPTNISVGFINSSMANYSRELVVSVNDLLKKVSIVKEPIDIVNIAKYSYNFDSGFLCDDFNSAKCHSSKAILYELRLII